MLGLEMDAYTAWSLGDGPNTHITSPAVWVPCEYCEQSGSGLLGLVECVCQGGFAKCVWSRSRHRSPQMPLDVGTTSSFTTFVAPMMTQSNADEEMLSWMEPEPEPEPEPESEPAAEAEAKSKMNPKFVDRVFKFLGFTDGIETRNHVRISERRN
jgi:hypothetical protein